MARGRPKGSLIRKNIIEILSFLGEAYGYEIYKHYRNIFQPVTLRVIYYHLKKGVSLNEFELVTIKKVSSDYSWGKETERIIYKLGSKAKPSFDNKVKEYFDNLSFDKRNNK